MVSEPAHLAAIYDCPFCEHSDTARMRLVNHVRDEHDTMFRASDVPARHVETQPRWTRIACQCARDIARTIDDPIFRHVDDDTLACIDPNTFKPYPPTPNQGDRPMTRIRPTSKAVRDWYGTLDEQSRANARQFVTAQMSDGVSQGDAWIACRDTFTASAAPVFDPPPSPTTPEPASDATATSERSRGRAAAICMFWLNDKPRRNLSDLAYDATRGMAGDAPRMTAAAFRSYLVALGIEQPDASQWCVELPNGNVIVSTLRGSDSKTRDELKAHAVKVAA